MVLLVEDPGRICGPGNGPAATGPPGGVSGVTSGCATYAGAAADAIERSPRRISIVWSNCVGVATNSCTNVENCWSAGASWLEPGGCSQARYGSGPSLTSFRMPWAF